MNRMTRLLISVMISGLLCADVQAQVKEFGIRGGVQASVLSGSEGASDPLTAFYAGVYADHAILMSGFVSFSPGMEYMQAGSWTDADNYQRIHYLSVPLAVRVRFGPWFAQTGLNANFRLAEKLISNGQDVLDDDNRSGFFDLPFQVGAGVRIGQVALETRLNLGFLDVNNKDSLSSLQLGLCISF